MLTLKIAIRYLFKFGRFHFITFITVISIIGIIIGITALICVMSIFNGFREFTEGQLTNFSPHLRIVNEEDKVINNYGEIIDKIKSIDDIMGIIPVIQIKAVAINQSNVQSVLVNGVNSKEIKEVWGLKDNVILGKFDLNVENGVPKIVLGGLLADKLRVLPGDTIRIISLKNIEAYLRTYSISTGVVCVVSAIFQSMSEDYDKFYAFIDNRFAYPLAKLPMECATSIDIRLSHIKNTDAVCNRIEKILSGTNGGLKVLTWYELHRDLYNVMRLERISTFIILSLIILISAFNILASLSMAVIEKRKDIAILKTLGLEDRSIRNIFVYQGLLVGVISSIIGGTLGILLCIGQQTYHWFKLDTSKYVISAIPVSINIQDVIFVIGLSLLLSIIATLYPSKQAVKINIIEAIRRE